MITKTQNSSLDKRLGAYDFFTIGFGAMIGVGWIIVVGDWLNLGGGPFAAIAAFMVGTVILLPIAFVYGELTTAMPVAGGSIAFTLKGLGSLSSYITGWFLALGYVMLCPWEAIAIGQIFGVLFPALKAFPLYTIGGYTIYAPLLFISLAISAFFVVINFKGINYVIKIQNILTKGILIIGALAFIASLVLGSWKNLLPVSFQTPLNPSGSIIMGFFSVLVLTPFFYAGFDTIPQEAEECKEDIDFKILGKVIFLALFSAGIFYGLMITATGMAMPWQEVIKLDMPIVEVYEKGLHLPIISKALLIGALCGLLTTLNSFFVAGARVILALGRANFLPATFASIHPKYKVPYTANILIAALTLLGPFFGKSILLPITNVCSLGFMAAWLMVSISAVRIRKNYPLMDRPYQMPGGIKMGYLAVIFSSIMLLLLVVPSSPGALKWPVEWGIVLIWALLGWVMYRLSASQRSSLDAIEQRKMVLGKYY